MYREFKNLKANSVDLNEMAHDEPPHFDLRCFSNLITFVLGALTVLKCPNI